MSALRETYGCSSVASLGVYYPFTRKMGLHSNEYQEHRGIGQKVETFIHGLGMIKTAYDVGGIVLGAARTLGPMAMTAGRAILPLIAAA